MDSAEPVIEPMAAKEGRGERDIVGAERLLVDDKMKKIALHLLQIADELLGQKKFNETISKLGEIDVNSISPDEKAFYCLLIVETNMYIGNYNFRDELNHALKYYKYSRDDNNFGRAKYLHGWLLMSQGNHFDAREPLLESYAMYKRCDNLFSQGKILNMLSFLCFQLGEIDVAIDYMKKSIAIYDDLGDDFRKMTITTNLAQIYYSAGRLADSIGIYEALRQNVPQWSDLSKAIYFFHAAIPYALKGNFTKAKQIIAEAVPFIEDFSREKAIYYENLGWIHLLAGESAEAECALLKGVELSMEIAPESALIAQIKRRLGDLYLEQEDPASARRFTDEALAVAKKINERVEIAACHRLYARLDVGQGNEAAARTWFKKSIDLFSMTGMNYELALTRYYAADSGIYFDGERQALLYLAREYFESEQVGFNLNKIDTAINKNIARVPRRVQSGLEPPVIIAVNPVMRRLISLSRHVAASQMTVLLSGSTGTGKDLMARYIHSHSGRQGRFIAINAAAIPDSMIEAELFGYRKGSFTGADRDKVGLIEEADNGTLYLNEIADATPEFQSKLLDVLEHRMVRRLGETRERPCAFRVIAATNQDLDKRILDNKFRVDLFHRLSEVPINLPPLSQRLDDIPALIKHFLQLAGVDLDQQSAAEQIGLLVKSFNERIWSGNIRQIKAEINRLALISKGDLTRMVKAAPHSPSTHREHLHQLLNQNQWNRREVARILGLSEGAVRKRIKKYNLNQRK
ncbi:MAG: AAA domain-containing protein [FCB group bacterium]|nr:AAA domain-containing protein [FCB group bacterium]